MEKDTEKQILEELEKMNQSLQEVKQNDSKEPSSLIYDVIRSLLIGLLIVGPAMAIVIVIFQYIIG